MEEACSIWPTINGEPSILYKNIYDFVGKDRKLTNFLYALSATDTFRSKFRKEDLNYQGELNFDSFKRQVNLEKVVDAARLISTEEKNLQVLDQRGEHIIFSNPNDIVQKVLDYNNAQETYVAQIVPTQTGYKVVVNVKNADNLVYQDTLQQRQAIYNVVMPILELGGLHVQLTEAELEAVNLYTVQKLIDTCRMVSGLEHPIISIDLAKLIKATIPDEMPLKARVLGVFGDNFEDALFTYTSGAGTYLFLSTEEKDLMGRFLDLYKRYLKKVDFIKIAEATVQEKTKRPVDKDEYGVRIDEIRATLNELYDKFDLNHDTINEQLKHIETLNQLAEQLAYIATKRTQRLNTEGLDKEEVSRLQDKEVLIQLQSADRLSAMYEILQSLLSQIEKTTALANKLNENEQDSLKIIRNKANVINNSLLIINALEKVLPSIINAENLEDDIVATLSAKLVRELKNVAGGIGNFLSAQKDALKKQQFDTLYQFFSLYWGEQDTKVWGGATRSLKGILELSQLDPTFCDKWVNALSDCSDPMLAMMGEAVLQRHRVRDAKLREFDYAIRVAQEELTNAGFKNDFMYQRDENGKLTHRLLTPFDEKKYQRAKDAERERLKEVARLEGKSKQWVFVQMNKWDKDNSESFELTFTGTDGKEHTYREDIPKLSLYGSNLIERLSAALRKYYDKMIQLKAELQEVAPQPRFSLFDAVEISTDFMQTISEANGDFTKIKETVKNEMEGWLGVVHTDEAGFVSNNATNVEIDLSGLTVKKIPVLYTRKLDNVDALSTDFGHAITAFAVSCLEYEQMSLIEDAFLLSKDWITNQREYTQVTDNKVVGEINKVLGTERFTQAVSPEGKAAATEMVTWALDKFIYLYAHDNDMEYTGLSGKKYSFQKQIGNLVGLNSVLGLGLNILGGEANFLVGKLQMLIESGTFLGGEFFNIGNMIKGDHLYRKMLIGAGKDYGVLTETLGEGTRSKLTLLMQRFGVLDDMFKSIRDKQYSKGLLNRILNNTSLLFAYEAGEHALHAEVMLAIMDANKIYDALGKEVGTLLDYFDVEVTGKNGKLIKKGEYYTKDGAPIDDEYLLKIEKQIKYCNKTLHGSLSSLDKGRIHNYWWGRLLMNFRQWMIGHYNRRFLHLKQDADLGMDREGYYRTILRLVSDISKDFYRNKGHLEVSLKNRYLNLSEMEKGNIKRAFSELVLLISLYALSALLGAPDKDNRGNWLYRNLQYEVARLLMEVEASTPYRPVRFGGSLMTQLNSPFAAMTTFTRVLNVANLSLAFDEVLSGKYKGENMYWHKNKKAIPFYNQLHTLWNLAEDEYAFTLFTKLNYK